MIASAPRLNVRMRCAASVVARPLGRLSMTCWFSACRSAISVDACSSCAPADRRLLASDAAEQRDGEEPEHVQRDGVLRHRSGRQRLRVCRQPGIGAQPGRGQVLRQHEAAVEDRAERGDQQAAAPELNRARGDDRQHVQRREVAGDPAGEVDERRDDQRVAGRAADRPASGAARRSAASARRRSSARR